MWGRAVICVVVGTTTVVVWYLIARRSNRRHAARIVEWIQAALVGKGQVLPIQWLGPSIFQIPLRLTTSVFHHPALLVRMIPRELPTRWLRQYWRREPATITFEADMDAPPGFTLEVHQHRWSGRTTRNFCPDPERWDFEQITPLIMTSRESWHREVGGMMNALLTCRNREFLRLAFRRCSPHFSATVTVESISPESHDGSNVFDTLRELATGASASRM